jgi:hypothetical protein
VSKLRSASIIISSYNYGRFLREAIDSALGQTYPNTEVIVVDDGSTDDSRDVIASYGDRIIPVLKENGGQASTWNAGFRESRGNVVVFLDSDDVLLPTAVEDALQTLKDRRLAKVHWPLLAINQQGQKTGQLVPRRPLPDGAVRETVLAGGPGSYTWPPSSGNAWTRTFLDSVFPMPEAAYRVSPDFYLAALAPLFGPTARITQPQSCWRIHGENNSWSERFEDRLERLIKLWDQTCNAMVAYGQAHDIHVEPERWVANSWHAVRRAVQEITEVVPSGDIFILVDRNHWATDDTVAGRRRFPFTERNGQYWGPPADDAAAIREVERLRQAGAGFVVFAWTVFWWLDHYAELHQHLRSSYRCALQNERVIIFDLRSVRVE